MKLSSKELTIILIELLITILLTFLLPKLNLFNHSESFLIIAWILLIMVVVSVVVFIFGIIYKRIGEIDKALEEQEIKQVGLEEKLKRCEQLIDIKADIKDLKRRIKKIENGEES